MQETLKQCDLGFFARTHKSAYSYMAPLCFKEVEDLRSLGTLRGIRRRRNQGWVRTSCSDRRLCLPHRGSSRWFRSIPNRNVSTSYWIFTADRSIRAQSDETSKVAPFMLKACGSICQGEEYSLIFNSRG